MENIRVINGKFYQEHEIIMVQIDGEIPKIQGSLILRDDVLHSLKSLQDHKKRVTDRAFELYFLSNDEIKELDWFWTGSKIKQCQKSKIGNLGYYNTVNDAFYWLQPNFKKIVATTDKILIGEEEIGFPCEINDLITNENQYLPNPSQLFIESFINAYNTDDKMNMILVEMRPNLTDGWIPSYNNPDNSGCDEQAEPDGTFSLKISPSNEIIIKPPKCIWSKNELYTIMQQYHDHCYLSGYITPMKWIDDNIY